MTETYIELEGLLSSSILNKEERERISALIADKLDQEQRMLNEMCTEIASFIELSKNGFFESSRLHTKRYMSKIWIIFITCLD